MAITYKEINIDGVDYEISAFSATKGIRVFKTLGKLIGPALKSLSDATDAEDASVKAITSLLQSMDDVAVEELMKDLMSCVSKGKVGIQFETEFQADYGKLVKLAQEVVNLNYGSLFTMLGTPNE